jgi:uncharacterized membrane protein
MKYTCKTTINQPIDKVATLWADENYFKEWQDGFQSIELLNGKANAVGAKSKIILDGNQYIELIETILINDLPKEKKGLYEHKHMTNTQHTKFLALSDTETEFISEVEYTQFNGLMIKIIAKLFPGKFKAQSQKWMDQFKEFAENHIA